MNQQAPAPNKTDRPAKVQAAADQLASVAHDFVQKQTDLVKFLADRCAGTSDADQESVGVKVLSTWSDSIASVIDAWFTSLQLTDTLIGSRWSNAPSSSDPQNSASTEVTVPAVKVATAIVSSDLDDGNGNKIPTSYIVLDPVALQAATETNVTITITPPSGTPSGTYSGSINDTAGNVLVQYEIEY